MIILGIETSCDETAVSIVEAEGDLLVPRSQDGVGDNLRFKLLGSAVNSQIEIHKEYGGVFPTLAKREHIKNLPVVLEEALKKAALGLEKIDLITVTVGPGLEPALWTGINFAQELGKKLNISVIPANHMLGHVVSVLFGERNSGNTTSSLGHKYKALGNSVAGVSQTQNIKFPAIALLISGGHTELILLKNWVEKEKLGETRDDAVGEAFDKVARMLGLPYPGGPQISKLAEEARQKNVSLKTKFPRPMIHSKDFNFSFSGLKTAVLYYLRNFQKSSQEQLSERDWRESEGIFQQKNTPVALENDFENSFKMAVSREFEDAVIETLVSKTKKALDEYSPKTLIIGGGVIANKALRESFVDLNKDYPELDILIPERSLTTDNATMIAAAGYVEYLKGAGAKTELMAKGNLDIT